MIQMDIFAKRLRYLREQKKKDDSKFTQGYVADLIGVARSTYTAYENGTKQPPLETINKIADLFGVSFDYLTGRTNDKGIKDQSTTLTDKDERDIAKRMEKLKKDLMEGANGEALTFRGEPMSPEAIESFLDAIEFAERQATRANKKYAPKKYRGKE